MKDLFVLNVDGETGSTETSNIFSQISEDINIIGTHQDNQDRNKYSQTAELGSEEAEVGNDGKSWKGSSRGKGKEKVDKSDGADEEANILKSLFDANGIHVSFFSIFQLTSKLSCIITFFENIIGNYILYTSSYLRIKIIMKQTSLY